MELPFIVDCLAHCLDPDRPLPEPPTDLDWNNVNHLLVRHGLGGILCVLAETYPHLWSQELQRALRKQRYTALLYGDHCVSQVKTVLTALHRAGLPAIVLKGWALIPTVYGGDYGQRTYADIDLLVPPQDVDQVECILDDLGYEGWIEFWPGYTHRYGIARSYMKPHQKPTFGQIFGIDLHTAPLGLSFVDRRMTADGLFERARPLRVAGVEAHGLCAEDDLIYSCGHLALHHAYDEALSRYYEIAAGMLQSGEAVDWDVVAERATAWRLTLPVQSVLARVEELWPGLIPAVTLESIASLQPTLTERCMHSLTMRQTQDRNLLLYGLHLPGLRTRLRFLLETLVPSPTFMRDRHGPAPGGLWPLLYFRRVLGWLKFLPSYIR